MWRVFKVIQFVFGWPSRWKLRRMEAGKGGRWSYWDMFMLMPTRGELQAWFDEHPSHFQQFIQSMEKIQRDLPEDTPEETRQMVEHTIRCHRCNFYVADTELALLRHESGTADWVQPEKKPWRSVLVAQREFTEIVAVAETLNEPTRTQFLERLKLVKARLEALEA